MGLGGGAKALGAGHLYFVIVLRVTLLTCARVCDLRCGCKREMNLQMCMRIHLAPQVIPAVKAGAIIVASPDLKEQVKI